LKHFITDRSPAGELVVAHIAARLGLTAPRPPTAEIRWSSKLYRYHAAVRARLGGTPYDEMAERLLSVIVLDAVETMSDPADLVNWAIEALRSAAIDTPGSARVGIPPTIRLACQAGAVVADLRQGVHHADR
jgi:hypothetical protein